NVSEGLGEVPPKLSQPRWAQGFGWHGACKRREPRGESSSSPGSGVASPQLEEANRVSCRSGFPPRGRDPASAASQAGAGGGASRRGRRGGGPRTFPRKCLRKHPPT